MRRANRKDLVHADIVIGLRQHGLTVWDMPQPGDVLVYGLNVSTGVVQFLPMEFKSSKAIRGKAENISNNKVKAPTPIPVVHDLAEALALFGLTV